jgi:hypothetical protein
MELVELNADPICGTLRNIVFNNGDDISIEFPVPFPNRATLVLIVDGKDWEMTVNGHYRVLDQGHTYTTHEYVGIFFSKVSPVSVCLTNDLMTVTS